MERRRKKFDELKAELVADSKLLENGNKASQVVIATKLLDSLQKLIRLRFSKAPQMLQSSLFLGMFSVYDIFTGQLLTAIYEKRPELFNRVNRAIPVSEILQHESFDGLRSLILQNEIESFRRKSYVEQFEELESTFGLNLRRFDQWPQFVECGQRRNLLTHCGGIVSEQYLSVCRKQGCALAADITVGCELKLDGNYFLSSCELIMKVGLELGQTLWRKVFPEELETADQHLIHVIYEDCLRMERWDRARVFGEFSVKQPKFSSDVNRKIFIVNYAIGLKFGGEPEKAKEVLSEVDWSSAAADFKLAEAVLLDRFDSAADIMKRIGKKGEFVNERSYHEWPVFHEFRKSTQFLDAYEQVYGHAFVIELQRTAAQAASTSESEEKVTAGVEEPEQSGSKNIEVESSNGESNTLDSAELQ